MERGHRVGLGSSERVLISARSCFLDRRQRAFRCLKTDLPKTKRTIETFVNPNFQVRSTYFGLQLTGGFR